MFSLTPRFNRQLTDEIEAAWEAEDVVRTQRTQGTIVGVEKQWGHGNGLGAGVTFLVNLPVVEFVDDSAQIHRFTSQWGQTSLVPTIGARVEVHYQPENPANASLSIAEQLNPQAATPAGLFAGWSTLVSLPRGQVLMGAVLLMVVLMLVMVFHLNR